VKLQHFYPLFLLCLLFWAGCVPTFQYNGITYPDSYQALNAQKVDIQMAINSITPRKNNLEGTAKLISPSFGTIRKYGVISGAMTPEISINYIISGLHSSYKALFRALKKRNIFKFVTLEERDNTIDPELNDETYLIWLEVKSKDSWEWHIKSNRIKKSRIHIDTTQVEATEIAKSWLNSIETILKTQSVNKIAQAKPSPPVGKAAPHKEQSPQSDSGSGFFVSKMGHVITNAHVVQNCKKITIGDNANKQVPAELINTDRSNDLALLKLSTLEMASADSKSLIQKLSIVVVPLASKGLLRSNDVKLGEKVLVAGYPFGDVFSNTIKVTSGIVSATRGAGDDSGQFQLDAAVQPGNSGGPIYDSGGNIVGVVVAQLDKLKMAKAIGSLPENVNFGIKASTVRQFLMSSGLPSKKSEQTEEKSTQQLAEIAKNQALMVMCLQ